jgi:hypothetical protein
MSAEEAAPPASPDAGSPSAEVTTSPRKHREFYPDPITAFKRTQSADPSYTFRPGREDVSFGAIKLIQQHDGFCCVERDIARMTKYLKAEKPPVTFKGRIMDPRPESEKLPDAKYDLPTYMAGKHPMARSNPEWSFSAAPAPKEAPERAPPPGSYNPENVDKASSPLYSMRPARRTKHYMGLPGCAPEGPFPDPPDVLKTGHRSNSMPNWTMRGRFKPMRKDLAMMKNTPGPGHYLSNVQNNRKFGRTTIGLTTRTGEYVDTDAVGTFKRGPSWGFGVGSRW